MDSCWICFVMLKWKLLKHKWTQMICLFMHFQPLWVMNIRLCSATNAKCKKTEKRMEEQNKTMRQQAITKVIAQLQNAGLIDRNILAALFVPPPRETSTSSQAAYQGDLIGGDESSTEDLTKDLTRS